MSGKRWAALILAVFLFFISGIYQLSISNSSEAVESITGDTLFKEKVIRQGKGLGSPRIAVLNLEGVIQDVGEIPFMSSLAYSHQHFLKMIEQAGEDEFIDGIILRVNSPGGGVVESAEIHDKLVEVRELYDKPIYVSMGNTAASGGYYVSAPADKIVAHPATVTGSIGVIMENINLAEFADKHGIDFNTITSGEYKDIMSISRPMREDEEVILQTIIDEMYDDFVQVIVEGRGMSEAEVRKIADGRIYTGRQAKDLNLIDDVGTFEDTVAMMESDHELEGAHLIQYEISFGLGQIFSLAAKNIFNKDTELLQLMNVIRDSSGPRAMYLYSK